MQYVDLYLKITLYLRINNRGNAKSSEDIKNKDSV